jgi:hypothetical protein
MDGAGDPNDYMSESVLEEMYGAVFDEGDDDESSPVSFKLIRGVNLRVERLVLPSLIS